MTPPQTPQFGTTYKRKIENSVHLKFADSNLTAIRNNAIRSLCKLGSFYYTFVPRLSKLCKHVIWTRVAKPQPRQPGIKSDFESYSNLNIKSIYCTDFSRTIKQLIKTKRSSAIFKINAIHNAFNFKNINCYRTIVWCHSRVICTETKSKQGTKHKGGKRRRFRASPEIALLSDSSCLLVRSEVTNKRLANRVPFAIP